MNDERYQLIMEKLSSGDYELSNEDLNKIAAEAINNHIKNINNISNASDQQRIFSKSSLQNVLASVELIKTTRKLNKANASLQKWMMIFTAIAAIAATVSTITVVL